MDLGKIGKKGLGNLGSGILGNHKKGGIIFQIKCHMMCQAIFQTLGRHSRWGSFEVDVFLHSLFLSLKPSVPIPLNLWCQEKASYRAGSFPFILRKLLKV